MAILKGRSDKKYCNLKCKNAFSNPKYKERQKIFKPDEKQLQKNYAILKMFYPISEDEEYVPIKLLYQQGFNPRYYIGTLKLNATGGNVYIVYDYAFLCDKESSIKIFHNEGGFRNI